MGKTLSCFKVIEKIHRQISPVSYSYAFLFVTWVMFVVSVEGVCPCCVVIKSNFIVPSIISLHSNFYTELSFQM